MKKDNKKKVKESNINELWKDLQKKLQEVAEEYKNLRSEIGDIDAFLREVVNNVVILLQEIHESISILEEKVAALEKGAPLPQIRPQDQQTTTPTAKSVPLPTSIQESNIPPPTQEAPNITQAQKKREQVSMPQQLSKERSIQPPAPIQKPSSPISIRSEVISQLKQVLEERRKKLKRQ